MHRLVLARCKLGSSKPEIKPSDLKCLRWNRSVSDHSSLLQDGEESSLFKVLDALAAVQETCGSLWKAISELQVRLNQNDEPEPEKNTQLPCHQCQKLSRHYEEVSPLYLFLLKIEYLVGFS